MLQWLRRQVGVPAHKVGLAGDSAGGQLTVLVTQRIQQDPLLHHLLPQALFLSSPGCGLDLDLPSFRSNSLTDRTLSVWKSYLSLSVRMYPQAIVHPLVGADVHSSLQARQLQMFRLAMVRGDVSRHLLPDHNCLRGKILPNFPPTYLWATRTEMLYDVAVELHRRIEAVGSKVRLVSSCFSRTQTPHPFTRHCTHAVSNEFTLSVPVRLFTSVVWTVTWPLILSHVCACCVSLFCVLSYVSSEHVGPSHAFLSLCVPILFPHGHVSPFSQCSCTDM